jgi:hypothetical protein
MWQRRASEQDATVRTREVLSKQLKAQDQLATLVTMSCCNQAQGLAHQAAEGYRSKTCTTHAALDFQACTSGSDTAAGIYIGRYTVAAVDGQLDCHQFMLL